MSEESEARADENTLGGSAVEHPGMRPISPRSEEGSGLTDLVAQVQPKRKRVSGTRDKITEAKRLQLTALFREKGASLSQRQYSEAVGIKMGSIGHFLTQLRAGLDIVCPPTRQVKPRGGRPGGSEHSLIGLEGTEEMYPVGEDSETHTPTPPRPFLGQLYPRPLASPNIIQANAKKELNSMVLTMEPLSLCGHTLLCRPGSPANKALSYLPDFYFKLRSEVAGGRTLVFIQHDSWSFDARCRVPSPSGRCQVCFQLRTIRFETLVAVASCGWIKADATYELTPPIWQGWLTELFLDLSRIGPCFVIFIPLFPGEMGEIMSTHGSKHELLEIDPSVQLGSFASSIMSRWDGIIYNQDIHSTPMSCGELLEAMVTTLRRLSPFEIMCEVARHRDALLQAALGIRPR
ncbi:hypothetical protein GMRT_13112 [Giardia muris]|uniref:Uncharacterized protein n=1 Tax=Giardia muris TaxID=5742 RepID=A0A4Z1TDB1_GIAMU|nr:hypothetical protein GMRT_13112 [Giardia muris]|eukprot:TNJ30521.1 hypothetical protein GMRT_13112 [Giardia muris]